MSTFDPQVLKYIPPNRIAEYLKKLHPGMVVSEGGNVSLVPGYIKDLEWNFYDESHRYYVHHTYDDMYKVMMGNYFSVNMVRWGNWPIFMQVANAKIDEGLFYQCMTILGIICLHQVQRITQKEEQVLIEINWYTASHWLFRWLHRPFNNMLLKLQKKQDHEDNIEIRQRRYELRKRGYHFLTDNPTFMNANILTDNAFPPSTRLFKKISLEEYERNKCHRIDLNNLEIMIRWNKNDTLDIWPGVCPHEGALLSQKHICNDTIICPWHGRRFPKTTLNKDTKNEWQFLNFKVNFHGNFIEVSEVENVALRSKPKLSQSASHIAYKESLT